MKFLHGTKAVFPTKTALTIGNFDGVHIGHQALLSLLKKQAQERNLPLAVLLFEPQPSEFFLKSEAPPRLSTLREKLQILAENGVDYVYCLHFNKKIAAMQAEMFAEKYIFTLLNAKYLLLGEDFRFGHNRTGDMHLLAEMAGSKECEVSLFPDFVIQEGRVSSTKIRQALSLGDLEKAQALLGRPYNVCAKVVEGKGLGRQWGIPTANLNLRRFTLPLKGVFLVSAKRANGNRLYGVGNVGYRPTLNGTKMVAEIHFFDFHENLYKEMLQVNFLCKLRDEIKFPSVEALIDQIQQDIKQAKELARNNSGNWHPS